MRSLLLSAAAIVGVVWGGSVPASADPLAMSGFNNPNVEEVGYGRRQYRRYGYPVPYAYYPPAYGYYVPPSAYTYAPAYRYYAPPPAYSYPPAYDPYAPPPANGDYGDYPAENGY